MRAIKKPTKIELTGEEQKLLAQINFNPTRASANYNEIVRSSCSAAAALTEALLSRQAVPEIRSRYFTDPKLAIGTRKSWQQIFEKNGTRGRAIFEHPHFLGFLQYFIFGPQLPEALLEEFVRFASDWHVGVEDVCKFSRHLTRRYHLDPHEACDEFFKLAMECGLADYEARLVRYSVRVVRNVK
jgi:hypothetical protein